MLHSIKALVIKDLKITFRNPILLFFSIIIPVVFIFLYSLIAELSTTNPVVISQNSTGEASKRIIEIMKTIHSSEGKYFKIKTTNPSEARKLYNTRKAVAMIEIPSNFDETLKKGMTPKIYLHVHNLNSDATKNYQLRLSNSIYLFQKEYNLNNSIKIDEIFSKFPSDVPMKLYTSIGLLMFAILYSSMINTGILIAREWEERTSKEIIMTPVGFSPLVIAKWITTLLITTISFILVMIIIYFSMDFPINKVNPGMFGWLFVLFLIGASLGSIIGIIIKKSLPIVTISGVFGISMYLVCGNESSIRGFAYGGGIEILWTISKYIPISQLTENIRYTFIPYGASPNYTSLYISLIFIALSIFSSIKLLKYSLYNSQGQ